MLARLFKYLMPRSLIWRAGLILVLPVVSLLLVVSVFFVNRHYEGVTRQMTEVAALQVRYLETLPMAQARRVARQFDMTADPVAPRTLTAPTVTAPPWDLAARHVARTLRDAFPEALAVHVGDTTVALVLPAAAQSDVERRYDIRRSRVSPRNPHQLLVAMAFGAALMTFVSFVFLKNQVRPIRRLAAVAEAFGRGRRLAYTPSGATEVRAAGHAFLTMRARIERQIESRTLMLSGVSHDLRTPLTRLRLGLEMQGDEAETRAMVQDVTEMEAMIARFLDFARAEAVEEPRLTDPVALIVQRLAHSGGRAVLRGGPPVAPLGLRAELVGRAIDNLVSNALRHGARAELWLSDTPEAVTIHIADDGPGIAPERRAEALRPFARLDSARSVTPGGSVGLGLAIVTETARAHGGRIEMDTCPDLGGLWVRLILPRVPLDAGAGT